MTSILTYLLQVIETVFDELELCVIMPPGHNGPYHDPETPTRNTGHWLVTLSIIYQWTGDRKYKDRARILAEYLCSEEARPKGYSFHHRNGQKDKCNGLIGQAWTFEALAIASEILEDPKYGQRAEDVFFQHHFNEHYGLWNRLEVDGKILSIDLTFNHQLWFASCASLLKTPREKHIKKIVVSFLDCLLENITVMDNGLIYHPIERKLNDEYSSVALKVRIKKTVLKILKSLGFIKYKNNIINDEEKHKGMIHKSIGYHQFNMYAFAMLKEQMPDHSFWKTKEFKKMVNYMLTDEIKQLLENNKYGFPYNPPGFEIPYALSVLGDLSDKELIDISEYWLNQQFMRCYNPKTLMMDRNTEDPTTHTARIYELTRLPQELIDKISIKSIDD